MVKKFNQKTGSVMITTLIIIVIMSSVAVLSTKGLSDMSIEAGNTVEDRLDNGYNGAPGVGGGPDGVYSNPDNATELVQDIENIANQEKAIVKDEIIEEVKQEEVLEEEVKEDVTTVLEEEVLTDDVISDSDKSAIEAVLINDQMTEEELAIKRAYADKLIHDIENRWGRPSSNQNYQLKGNHEVTWDDLTVLYLYAITYDGVGFGGLNEPVGIYRDVLITYKLIEEI